MTKTQTDDTVPLNILFVVDELPYPPRNGVTIPTFNYMRRLSSRHNVFLLCFVREDEKLDRAQMEENRRYVQRLWTIRRARKGVFSRIGGELIGQAFYSLGWRYGEAELQERFAGLELDVVWVSPVTVADCVDVMRRVVGVGTVFVCGINDCTTALLRSKGRELFVRGGTLRRRVVYFTAWLRSFPGAVIERKLVDAYDLVLVQTDVDRNWFIRLSSSLSGKLLTLPNGANELLAAIPMAVRNSRRLLYFGGMSGRYVAIVDWLVDRMWPHVREADGEASFILVGKDPAPSSVWKMLDDSRIVYTPFVPDIRDVFEGAAVVVAPVFKRFGLINKVVESMLAGLPVVGDWGSFNGITGFVDGVHGFVAPNAEAMARIVVELLDDSDRRLRIGEAARDLIRQHFSWGSRVDEIEGKLVEVVGRRMQGE